jgi:hypothetical protein
MLHGWLFLTIRHNARKVVLHSTSFPLTAVPSAGDRYNWEATNGDGWRSSKVQYIEWMGPHLVEIWLKTKDFCEEDGSLADCIKWYVDRGWKEQKK